MKDAGFCEIWMHSTLEGAPRTATHTEENCEKDLFSVSLGHWANLRHENRMTMKKQYLLNITMMNVFII